MVKCVSNVEIKKNNTKFMSFKRATSQVMIIKLLGYQVKTYIKK